MSQIKYIELSLSHLHILGFEAELEKFYSSVILCKVPSGVGAESSEAGLRTDSTLMKCLIFCIMGVEIT